MSDDYTPIPQTDYEIPPCGLEGSDYEAPKLESELVTVLVPIRAGHLVKENYRGQEVTYLLPGSNIEPNHKNCGNITSVAMVREGVNKGRKIVKHDYCHEPSCPVCWASWVRRASQRALVKCAAFLKARGRLQHWIVSADSTCEELLRHARKFFEHGLAVYHPYRYKVTCACGRKWGKSAIRSSNGVCKCGEDLARGTREYHRGPHLHVVTPTRWVGDTAGYSDKTGVNFKHVREVDSVLDAHGLLSYEFGHAGVGEFLTVPGKRSRNVARYWGDLYKLRPLKPTTVEEPVTDEATGFPYLLCDLPLGHNQYKRLSTVLVRGLRVYKVAYSMPVYVTDAPATRTILSWEVLLDGEPVAMVSSDEWGGEREWDAEVTWEDQEDVVV